MRPERTPTCDQSVVWQLKIAWICLRLRLATGLLLLTTMAMPSSAKTCSQAGEVISPRAVSVACSAGLILRDAMPISHVPFARDSKAVAEPRASTWTDCTALVPETTPWSEYSSGSFPGTRVMLDQPS